MKGARYYLDLVDASILVVSALSSRSFCLRWMRASSANAAAVSSDQVARWLVADASFSAAVKNTVIAVKSCLNILNMM